LKKGINEERLSSRRQVNTIEVQTNFSEETGGEKKEDDEIAEGK